MNGAIPDRSIPFYNTLMRCDAFAGAGAVLSVDRWFVGNRSGHENERTVWNLV